MSEKDHEESNGSIILAQIKDSIKIRLQTTFSWLDTVDGQILSNGIKTISPFIIGEPIGFLFPFIIESADILIRKRFLNALSNIGDKLEIERNNLNIDIIMSSEGQQLLKNTFRNIIQENNEEKIESLKKFLIVSYTEKNLNSELTNTFFNLLKDMEPIHMKLLTVLKNPKEIFLKVANERKKIPRPEDKKTFGKHDYVLYWSEDTEDDLNQFYLHSEPVVYSNAHKDLVTWNILDHKIMKFWLYFDNTTFDQNLESHLKEIDHFLTPFGKKFLEHIYQNDNKR